jgi:hypothetical protein
MPFPRAGRQWPSPLRERQTLSPRYIRWRRSRYLALFLRTIHKEIFEDELALASLKRRGANAARTERSEVGSEYVSTRTSLYCARQYGHSKSVVVDLVMLRETTVKIGTLLKAGADSNSNANTGQKLVNSGQVKQLGQLGDVGRYPPCFVEPAPERAQITALFQVDRCGR